MTAGDTRAVGHTTTAPRRSRMLTAGFMAGAFALGTSESVVSGILPQVAAGTGSSLAEAGSLVLAYAGAVTVLGPPITLLLARFDTRRVLTGLLLWYVAAAVLAAAAPGFEVLVAARVLAGAAHTSILVRFSLTALRLARPGHEARAIGLVLGGLTAASVLGVPAGVALAGLAGWPAPFVLIAVLSALSLAVVLRFLPPLEPPVREPLPTALARLGAPPVLVGLALSVLCAGASMLVMTYVAPLLLGTGLDATLLPAILLLYGAGGVLGNLLGARLADRDQAFALTASTLALTGTLAVLWFFAPTPWAAPALIAVGVAYFATITPISALVARAGTGPASDVALAVNSSAFNLGIAAAAGAGGAVIASGAPASALPAWALLPAALALMLVLCWRAVRVRPA